MDKSLLLSTDVNITSDRTGDVTVLNKIAVDVNVLKVTLGPDKSVGTDII